MAVETQDRWTEIRKLHVDWKDAYRILGGAVLVGIGVVIGAGWFANSQADGYTTNLYTEFISIGVTVFILDFLNRRRDERRRVEDLKAQLLRQVRSPEPAIRNHAIHEIREHGWVAGEDGLLKGADLIGAKLQGVDLEGANLQEATIIDADLQEANLEGADLRWASLEGTNLKGANLQFADLRWANFWGANLQEANLRFADLRWANFWVASLQEANLHGANLQGVDLERADLQGADLLEANLQGADLARVSYDAKTLLPDAKGTTEKNEFTPDSYWTPETDMTRYTDPTHPDFWQPEWVKGQGGEPKDTGH